MCTCFPNVVHFKKKITNWNNFFNLKLKTFNLIKPDPYQKQCFDQICSDLISFDQMWSGLIRLKNLNFKLIFFSKYLVEPCVFQLWFFRYDLISDSWFKLFRLVLAFFLIGPKKAMKSMKSGMGKPAMKSDLGKAVKKNNGKTKGKGQRADSKKNTLNKTNLKKLGHMSLEDKIQAAAESGGTVEEQAEVLKDRLTKVEHAKVWGRHQTHLNKTPLEKWTLEGLSKKEKGVKAAEWLMRTAGKKYLRCCRKVTASESLEKDNTWKSENQMMDQFGADELRAHCGSVRVVWRADTHTPDVWQHKDTKAWKGSLTNGRNELSKNAGKVGSRHRCFSRVASQSCPCLAMTASFRLRIWVSVQFPTMVELLFAQIGDRACQTPEWGAKPAVLVSDLSVHTCGLAKGFFREVYTSGLGSSHEMYYCRFCASDVAVPGLLVFRGKW